MCAKLYNGKYLQGSLDDKVCGALSTLVESVSEVTGIKNCIVNFPFNIVSDIISDYENYEKEHGTIAGFKKSYTPIPGELTPAQTVGVAFMYYAQSALLGDEVGLGKTVQCAGLINLLKRDFDKAGKPFRFCFLTEKSSIKQIRRKLIQFTGTYVGELETGEQRVVKQYIDRYEKGNHCSIVGGHSLLNSSEFLIHTAQHPFDLIVIDESSIIKNTTSDIFKNTKALFKFHKRKILLNATPLEQNVLEFYNQLNLLDPYFLPPLGEFKKRYCIMERGVFGYTEISGYKNTEEFKTAVGLRYIGRTRASLGAKYEGNEYKIVIVPLSKEQKKLQRNTSLYSLIYDYPTGVDRNVDFNLETTPKAGALISILKNLDMSSSKVLVYCRFVDCQARLKELMENEGFRVAILNGTSKIKERNELLDRFLNNEFDVLITNIQKGLDINNCDTCIMYTIDPNPQKMVQFEGRMTRDFDVQYKNLYMLVADGREKKFVEETLKLRVDATDAFVSQGKSMTTKALKDFDNIVRYNIDTKKIEEIKKDNLGMEE